MHFVAETVARARRAGAAGELTLRADSGFFSYDLLDRLDALKVRRSRLGDPQQAALWPDWRYHAFVTNRTDLDTIAADKYHRAHATVELATGDLKNSTGLAHLPSGSFAANAAWLACAALAHNLYRWLNHHTGRRRNGKLTADRPDTAPQTASTPHQQPHPTPRHHPTPQKHHPTHPHRWIQAQRRVAVAGRSRGGSVVTLRGLLDCVASGEEIIGTGLRSACREPATPVRATVSVDRGCGFDGGGVGFPSFGGGRVTVFGVSLFGAGDLLGIS